MLRQSSASLRQIYRVCARDSAAGRLGSAEIAACSIAYDVLLKHHFGDEFAALLGWSSAVRDEPVACASASWDVSGSDE